MKLNLCWLLASFLVAMSGLSVFANSYPSDPVCQTLGRASRDAALTNNVYLRKRDQQCKIPLKGGGIGLYTYSLNQASVPIISRALAFVASANLGAGDVVSDSSRVYAIKLGGQNALAGTILGSSLGGSGSELANIIPVSDVALAKWRNFEAVIYDCINSGKSSSVKLRWLFSYRSSTDTRPYAVEYSASFQGGSNNCEHMVQIFDN